MPDFYCRATNDNGAATAHAPYPGLRVIAVDADAAIVTYAVLTNAPSGVTVLVWPHDACKAYKIGGFTSVALPAYT